MTITHFGFLNHSAGLSEECRAPLLQQRARTGDREHSTTTMSRKHLTGHKTPARTTESLDNHFDFDVDVRIAAKTSAGRTTSRSVCRFSVDRRLISDGNYSVDLVDVLADVWYSTSGRIASIPSGCEWSVIGSQRHIQSPTRCSHGGGH